MAIDLKGLLEIPALSLHLFEARYGGGFIAFVGHNDHTYEIIDLHLGGDVDYAQITSSLVYSKWYPIGSGNTPMEAIAALESFLKNSEFARSETDTGYALSMLLERVFDRKGNLISTKHPQILRKYWEGPYGDAWVDELAGVLDELSKNQG